MTPFPAWYLDAGKRAYHTKMLFDSNRRAMLQAIRRQHVDRAAERARDTAHYARRLSVIGGGPL